MGERDIELGRLHADTTSAHGPQVVYFQEISKLGVLLDNTAIMVQKLKEANLEFSSATESDAMKEINGRMEKDMDEVGKMAHTMKEKLNRIFQGVLTPILNNLSNDRGCSVTLPMTMDPSTMSMIRALKIKFKERKNDLKNLRKTIWEEYLEVVQRRTFTVTGKKLSDEVIRVIDTGNMVQMLENALQGISPEQVVQAVDEIKERHAAAMVFGKKVLELQQNFAEMAAVVKTREKIDKALNQVQKLKIRAQSNDEELRDLIEENDQLCAENDQLFAEKDRLFVVVIGLSLFLYAFIIFLGVTRG